MTSAEFIDSVAEFVKTYNSKTKESTWDYRMNNEQAVTGVLQKLLTIKEREDLYGDFNLMTLELLSNIKRIADYYIEMIVLYNPQTFLPVLIDSNSNKHSLFAKSLLNQQSIDVGKRTPFYIEFMDFKNVILLSLMIKEE